MKKGSIYPNKSYQGFIEKRFKKMANIYTRTEEEARKYSHYLIYVALKKALNYADQGVFIKIKGFAKNKNIEMLYITVEPYLNHQLQEEMEKASNIIDRGKFQMMSGESSDGFVNAGSFFIKSEQAYSDITYEIYYDEENNLSCTCGSYKRLMYSGLICKHIACLMIMMLRALESFKMDSKTSNGREYNQGHTRKLQIGDK